MPYLRFFVQQMHPFGLYVKDDRLLLSIHADKANLVRVHRHGFYMS